MNSYLKKDLNLFAAVGKERGIGAIDLERSIKKSLLVFAAIFGVALLIVCGGNGIKKSKIDRLNADIEALQADLQEIEQFKLEAETLQRDIDKFNEAIAAFNVSQRITTEDVKNVARCMPQGLTLTSFNYAGGNISLSVTGTTELMIADFANSLRTAVVVNKNATTEEEYSKPMFKSVSYTGVSKAGESYTGSIQIALNDIVIEEPETEETSAEETTAAQ